MSRYRSSDVVFLGAKRSPLGSLSGSLASLKPVQLGAPVLKGLISSLPSLSLEDCPLEQIIIGQALGAGTGQSLPRQVFHSLGLPPPSSAFIINQLCGSSLEAVLLARQSILTECYSLVAAGGIEAPSAAPYLLSREEIIGMQEMPLGEAEPKLRQSALYDSLWCAIHDTHTIVHGEETTARWVRERGLNPDETKARIDSFARESHERALAAREEGLFDKELVLSDGWARQDELPHHVSLEKLKRRRGTGFSPGGIYLSAHNSPPLANGAAFVLLSSYEEAAKRDLPPMARILDYARVGVREEDFLLAPVLAVRKLLEKTRMVLDDFDVLELNPAFGSQMLFYEEDLKADMKKVNIQGDCLSLGHPIGAAGTRLITTLLHRLEREDLSLGLVAICMGGGNGIALAVERCS